MGVVISLQRFIIGQKVDCGENFAIYSHEIAPTLTISLQIVVIEDDGYVDWLRLYVLTFNILPLLHNIYLSVL